MATKRIKPNLDVAVIKTLAEADSALARIATFGRYLEIIEAQLNEDIAALKLKAEETAEPFRQKIVDLEVSLGRYAELHKDELFTDKTRSKQCAFGSFGYRFSSELDTVGGVSWKAVLEKLESQGLTEYIRSKPEVDREALRKAPADILKRVKCTIREKDVFWYEVAREELSEGTNAA